MLHNTTAHSLLIEGANKMPPLAKWAIQAIVLVTYLTELRQTRKALARLDPHELADIGISPIEAHRESSRGFFNY